MCDVLPSSSHSELQSSFQISSSSEEDVSGEGSGSGSDCSDNSEASASDESENEDTEGCSLIDNGISLYSLKPLT